MAELRRRQDEKYRAAEKNRGVNGLGSGGCPLHLQVDGQTWRRGFCSLLIDGKQTRPVY